ALLGIAQARVLPRPLQALAWWRAQRDLSWRYLGEYIVDQGARQLSLVLVGAIVGLQGLAALRGAQTFMGPVTMLDLAARALLVPEGAKLHQHSARAAYRLFVGVAAALCLGALAWGAIGAGLPAQAGRALLGDTWPSARAVLPAMAVLVAANGVAAGAVGG